MSRCITVKIINSFVEEVRLQHAHEQFAAFVVSGTQCISKEFKIIRLNHFYHLVELTKQLYLFLCNIL